MYDLLEISLASLIIILILFSFCFTIAVKIETQFLRYKNNKVKSYNKQFIVNLKSMFRQIKWKNLISDVIYLKSLNQVKIALFWLSFFFLIIVYKLNININSDYMVILVIPLIIIFYGIGLMMHNTFGDKLLDRSFYIIKVLIVLTYSLSAISGLMNNLQSPFSLFFTVILSIIYSFALIKSVIDGFTSYLFQFFNFIILLVILNFLVIGLSFGMYYLNNYLEYTYIFNKEDYENIMNSSDLNNLLYVIYKGLTPFFSYPSNLENIPTFNNYIPIIEHFIGYIFNLGLIGFFMSYSVSKLIERKNSKKVQEVNYFI